MSVLTGTHKGFKQAVPAMVVAFFCLLLALQVVVRDMKKQAAAWGRWRVNQLHPGFAGGSTSLAAVAGDTGADHILPGMLTTPVSGNDMVQGELQAAIVLSLPTMSPLFYESLVNQDIYITGSLLLMYSVLLVVGNLLADLALGILDPRIRYE